MTAGTPRSVAADLVAVGAASAAATQAVVTTFTAALHRGVVARASGRPGPNAVTGHYRRSINRQVEVSPLGSTGTVGTNAPQGRRLELGFTGTDSLGRNYDQPPFPHFGPALDEVAEPFAAAVALIPGALAERGTR